MYKTKDLAEAGALLVSGQALINIEREGKTCWFIFNNEKQCQEISGRFFFGKLMVNAREFYDTISRLKNRVFSLVDEYGTYRKNNQSR